MPSVQTIFFPAFAYLLGSIPFGLLLARMRGVDVRSVGSGNIGATNVTRAVGKGFGLLTFCADLSKGLIPVLVCRAVLPAGLETQTILAFTGFGAVLGHCFPVFLGFQGGKGIATASGVFLGICPLALAPATVLFALAFWLTRIVSVGSLLASLALPVALHFLCTGCSGPVEVMTWAVTLLVWWKHRGNIQRLLRGEELGFRRSGV
ncbi:MAG: glycerol-3-phosphate 1-O-acyltransferase PlsY [Deltaproteobacteria bacterium]